MQDIVARIGDLRALIEPAVGSDGIIGHQIDCMEFTYWQELNKLVEHKLRKEYSEFVPWLSRVFGKGQLQCQLHPLERQWLSFVNAHRYKGRYTYATLVELLEDGPEIHLQGGIDHNSVLSKYHAEWKENYSIPVDKMQEYNARLKDATSGMYDMAIRCRSTRIPDEDYSIDRFFWFQSKGFKGYHLKNGFDFFLPTNLDVNFAGAISDLREMKQAYQKVKDAARKLVILIEEINADIASTCERKTNVYKTNPDMSVF